VPLARLASLSLTLALSLGASETARAWCQSCTVSTVGASTCSQACFCPVETNPDAHYLFWDRRCMELAVMDAPGPRFTTEELDQVVARSFGQWTDADCGGRTPGFEIRLGEERALCDVAQYVSGEGNTNAIAIVHDDWSERALHDDAAFALTTTFFLLNTGEIIDADMELNEDDWDFAVCPEEGCMDGAVDLENTITHEAGHFFGLAHNQVPESTMWACADAGEVFKRDLEADDIEGICTIYGPAALPDECRFEPRGGFDPYCAEDREDCGCRIAHGGGDAPTGWLALFGLLLFWRRQPKRR
jgi:MYXO-CTERM domain-containing protein